MFKKKEENCSNKKKRTNKQTNKQTNRNTTHPPLNLAVLQRKASAQSIAANSFFPSSVISISGLEQPEKKKKKQTIQQSKAKATTK